MKIPQKSDMEMEDKRSEPDDPMDMSAEVPYCWRATLVLQPGMIIARPVTGLRGQRIVLQFAPGGRISVDTIAQLVAKGVECVAVFETAEAALVPDPGLVESYQTRLDEIFGQNPDQPCQELRAALLACGPCRC